MTHVSRRCVSKYVNNNIQFARDGNTAFRRDPISTVCLSFLLYDIFIGAINMVDSTSTIIATREEPSSNNGETEGIESVLQYE